MRIFSALLVLFAASVTGAQTPPTSGATLLTQAQDCAAGMPALRQQVRTLLEKTRETRDVTKINCLNDKLNQIDSAITEVGNRMPILQAAVATNDMASAQHQYNKIKEACQRASQLATEARNCIGAETSAVDSNAAPVVIQNDPPATNATSACLTHGELAERLTVLTGLHPYLPLNASDADYFSALMLNGIYPNGGWSSGACVTFGELAQIIVRALGAGEEIKNPDDPKEWFSYLASVGIDLTPVWQGLGHVTSNGYIDDPGFLLATTDPLSKDELDPILYVLSEASIPSSPPPMTPQ